MLRLVILRRRKKAPPTVVRNVTYATRSPLTFFGESVGDIKPYISICPSGARSVCLSVTAHVARLHAVPLAREAVWCVLRAAATNKASALSIISYSGGKCSLFPLRFLQMMERRAFITIQLVHLDAAPAASYLSGGSPSSKEGVYNIFQPRAEAVRWGRPPSWPPGPFVAAPRGPAAAMATRVYTERGAVGQRGEAPP